jgi:hypothetical protein
MNGVQIMLTNSVRVNGMVADFMIAPTCPVRHEKFPTIELAATWSGLAQPSSR